MKRLILTAAIVLAASTPAFAQNTEQENDAAMAAVIYTIAQKRCNLTTAEASRNDHRRDRTPRPHMGASGLRREADDRSIPQRASGL